MVIINNAMSKSLKLCRQKCIKMNHSGTWKLRKRKTILYIFYGLVSWLFPTFGIPNFQAVASAAILESNFDQQSLFDSDDDLLTPSKIHQERTFESDIADEENDAKLYVDIVESIKQWQQNKIRKSRQLHHRAKRDEEVVCYKDVGCFHDDGPFDYLDMLPSPPEEVNTVMLLFTKQNEEKAQIIEYNNVTTVLESNYNASLDTKLIIHGFGSSCNRVWAREMRLALLEAEDVNVICVDWSAGAADPNYVRAAVNTRLVGKQVALLIQSINDASGVNINNRTHMVGFSLGAHVAGFAGNHLKNLSRITGLDPAGPLFEGYDGKVRLDKSDANYVDVIHSNGESLIVGGFGTWEAIGHVDFYPNGGRAQRGCQHFVVGGLYDLFDSYHVNDTARTPRYLCNHRRAYKLFTDSISPGCVFTSFPCDDYDKFQAGECFSCGTAGQECGKLGYYSDQSKGRGSLYLLTRDEEPFCGTQYKVSVLFSRSRGPVQTYGKLMLMLVDKNGNNETITLTKDVDDLLTSGTKIEKIITVRPDIEPVIAYLLYIAYDGWIFSGRHVWRVDKILMKSGSGEYLSHCKANEAETVLRSGIPSEFNLLTGDCAVPIIGLDHYLYKYQKKPAGHDNYFPPQINNEPLNALLPPPPPPPASSSSKPDEYVMDTKIIQIAEAADNAGDNSIQINDEVAEVRLDSLKKNEYHTIEIWDSLAPNSVPAGGLEKPSKIRPATTTTSTEPSASFWPGFLDFFSSGSSSSTTRSPHHQQRPSKRPSRPAMKKPPTQMITLSSKNGTQQQHVTMHHLSSDEQLTILKVDDEDDDATNSSQPLTINDNDVSDEKYIVLHKLPNGEALNLENLETYSSMADVEDGIQRNTPYHPRSLMPNIDYVIPPSIGDMIISERPIAKPDIYEPIPLDQLEDLEAMPFQQQPVYIINPLKGDLNESGEILPPTEEEVEEAIMQANVELYKLNQTSESREDKFLHGIFGATTSAPPTTSQSSNPEDVSKKQFFETQTVVYDFNWTPIPKRPTFGPARPPPHFRLDELSHLAHVSIPEHLYDEVKNETSPIINVQVLPARLSAVLYQVTEKHRSLQPHRFNPVNSRQNKIAPIFKLDPTGLDRKRAKSLELRQHYRSRYRNPLRRFQTQLVPGNPHKYIPLHVKATPRPRLWWQPSIPPSYASVTIVNSAIADDEESTTTTSYDEAELETTTLTDEDYFTELTTDNGLATH